jgi:hypothetical protein
MPERFDESPGASDEDLLKVVRLLNAEGARYLVVGGFATILHQVPRFTRDVDILIAEDEANFAKVISALSRLADGAAKGLAPSRTAERVSGLACGSPPVTVSDGTRSRSHTHPDCRTLLPRLARGLFRGSW